MVQPDRSQRTVQYGEEKLHEGLSMSNTYLPKKVKSDKLTVGNLVN